MGDILFDFNAVDEVKEYINEAENWLELQSNTMKEIEAIVDNAWISGSTAGLCQCIRRVRMQLDAGIVALENAKAIANLASVEAARDEKDNEAAIKN